MKNKNRALLSSVLSLILCISMLLGTTFAWFTDEVTSTGNIIKSGTLDATMEWKNPGDTEWKDASIGAIFNYEYWEPGYTELKFVKVENKGDLAFKFRLDVIPATPAAAGAVNLADVIDVYMVEVADPANLPTVDRAAIAGMTPVGTLSQLMMDADGAAYGVMLPTSGSTTVDTSAIDPAITKTGTITYGIALKMQESAGNDYMNKTVGGQFSVRLLAAQMTYEGDSFGADYDTNAQYSGKVIDYAASTAVTADNGAVAQDATIGNDGEIKAAIPAGVKLADGATELELSVKTLNDSQANVTLDSGESLTALDIHIEGVAGDNQQPMTITLPGLLKTGLNTTSVAMYHVEDGVTVPMDLVTNPAGHNEFSYDPATGDVVVSTATFSEYVAKTDNKNLWKGKFDYSWYIGKTSPYTIKTADQLAGFGRIVDGTADGIAADTFEGKIIYLANDIDLSGGYSLNPIGCGYVDKSINSGNVEGRPFKGTFDGGRYNEDGELICSVISGLYQNGWDIGLEYCNLGGGLFASIAHGTVRNLIISGADIKMECVEQGILVGLSQGACTYENIKIYNSKVANYQRATGGLIGEVSGGGTTTISNVTIGSDVVVGSLWGDFDAPVGGVIGGYWDDTGATKVMMTNVTAAARLDVYNDVTSSYQWYAYRRAGMLVGNTDMSARNENGSNVATADFLTCENVAVYYGPWVDYHYCEFGEDFNSPSWPWVRVEAGENCNAYSNPRWGVAKDANGNAITDTHTETDHAAGGDHNVPLPFNQLYGGGQGVYGQTEHKNVTIKNYTYTIQYTSDDEVLAETFVESKDTAFVIAEDPNSGTAQKAAEAWVKDQGYTVEFGGWVNAGSTKVTSIEADNTENIKLYPYFNSPHTARFVDQDGNVLAWCLFHAEKLGDLETARALAESKLPELEHVKFKKWIVQVNTSTTEDYNRSNFAKYSADVTVYPDYVYDGKLNLVPVDSDGDGATNYYKVQAVADLDDPTTIPGYVNGIPVKEVERLYQNSNSLFGGIFDYGAGVNHIIIEEGVEDLLHNSLAYTSDLDEVQLPSTIKSLAKNTFSRNSGDDRKVLTINYNGTVADFAAIKKDKEWHNGLKTGTKVICTDGEYCLDRGWTGLGDYDWTVTYY